MTARLLFLPALLTLGGAVGCGGDPGTPDRAGPDFFPQDGAVIVADYEISWSGAAIDSLVVHLDGTRLGTVDRAPFRLPVVLVDHPPGEHVIRAHLYSGTRADTVLARVLMCHGLGHDVGNFAASRSLPDRQGALHALNDPGDEHRLVLLDFWATWCPPCLVSLPDTERLHREYGPLGLKVLTVDAEPWSVVDPFMAANGYTFRVLHDENGTVSRIFGAYAIPTYYLIDDRGIVRDEWLGSGNGAAIEAGIRRLLELE